MVNFKRLLWTIINVLIRAILIAVFIVFIIVTMSRVLRPIPTESDNSREKVDGFYALLDDSIDILVLGTSHAYTGINPAVLYHYTNAASYDFAGQCQPIEVTYHYLVEALKTQHPKCIILDIFALSEESSKCQIDGAYRSNIQDLKITKNKYEAYKMMDEEHALVNTFDMFLYKDRLKDVTLDDIKDANLYRYNRWFGYSWLYPTSDFVRIRDAVVASEPLKPNERRLEYFMKIVDLCEKENIDLMVIKTPYYIDNEDLDRYNYIKQICEERDIFYIDYNDKLDELNYVFDLDGDSWHANVIGAYKITRNLSNILNERYTFEGESIYKDEYARLYKETVTEIFMGCRSMSRLFEYIPQMDVTCIVNDKANVYTSDNSIVIVNQNGVFPGSFVSINDHKAWIEENGELWYDYELMGEANGNFWVMIVDNLTGELIGNVNVFNLGW